MRQLIIIAVIALGAVACTHDRMTFESCADGEYSMIRSDMPIEIGDTVVLTYKSVNSTEHGWMSWTRVYGAYNGVVPEFYTSNEEDRKVVQTFWTAVRIE